MIELWNGCCLDLMKNIPDGSVDMVLCDLPYGTTTCSWDAVIPFEPLWAAYRRVAKPNAAIVLTASQPFTSFLVASNPNGFKHSWIYTKTKATNFLNARKGPLKYHEDVLVFSFGAPSYFPVMECGAPYKKTHRSDNKDDCAYGKSTRISGEVTVNEGLRFPSSVMAAISNPSGRGQLHPTQKPVALMEYLIRTYTNPGDTVLDNTMGSGTTGVAAVQSGRSFIGIERDPDYFKIAQERVRKHQEALL